MFNNFSSLVSKNLSKFRELGKSKLQHLGKYKIFQKPIFKLILGFFVLVFLLDILFPFEVEPNYSTLVTASDNSVLYAFLNKNDKWRMKTELSEITPTLRKAIIFKEDRWFYWHLGFNPLAIIRATFKNIFAGKRTSGASTITMQVVRLLQPQERTYFHKFIEIFRAVQLEIHYSKDEILQLYLNFVPYGSNIEGLKSASILYFQKLPDRLSLAEVTALSIIPNRPSSLRLGQNNAYIQQERNKWLERFKAKNVFETSTINDAEREPLAVVRHDAPHKTPQLALRLKKENPREEVIKTNISTQKQANIEQLTQNYVNRLRAMNIQNAAVLLINNQTHVIEAYIGSANFENKDDGGQVDGIRAIRSPGSTLKPLLYATAFEQGVLTPKTAVNDVPTNFGGYEPENFDQDFHGKVTIEFALANSLNIPAVKVLKEIGTPALIEKLKKANFESIKKNSSNLGLSMILGGCGVNLEELTNLFSAYANGGYFQKNNILKTPASKTGIQLISEESNYMITQILAQITRPDLPNNYDYTYRMPKIAWKTGTSFGRKDAWSIGYNQHYTVGVWVGNFSGVGVPELSGASIATPLLFDIFNAIDYSTSANWFQQPKNVYQRQVCAESGDLPNDFCTSKILDYYIPSVSKMTICEHLKGIWVDEKAKISYCSSCIPESGFLQKYYPNFAPELLSYYDSKRIFYEKIPPHNLKCERIFSENPPKITYPVDKSEYFLDRIDKQQLLLSCQSSNDVKEVFWYINDKFYQRSESTKQVFFKPKAGKIKISCTDDKGRNSDISIKVSY